MFLVFMFFLWVSFRELSRQLFSSNRKNFTGSDVIGRLVCTTPPVPLKAAPSLIQVVRVAMSLVESSGAISKAAKELWARWHSVQGVWQDAQSREFETVYLFQIEQDVRSALGAIDRMNQVLQKIENDCE